jgi:hypothetical protein
MPVLLVFLVKLVVTVLLSAAVWFTIRYRTRLQSLVETREGLIIALLLVALRVVPFVAVFLVLNETPRGDIPFFYWKADLAHQGKLVYRDFWSFHSPLFSYLLALPVFLWNSPKVIVALMGVGEAICVWVTYRFYRRADPRGAFWKSVVYLLLPAPLIICLLGGQEDIWLWGFGVWAVMASRGGRDAFRVGMVLALALLTLKVTFVLIVFPLFFLLRDKVRFTGALLAVGVPALAVCYFVFGWLFLMPVQHADLPFSPNFVSILRPFTFGWLERVPLKYLNWFGMALTISVASLAGWRFRDKPLDRVLPALWVVTFGTFMLVQPSAMAYYLFLILIVLVFELTDLTNTRQVALLLLVNLLVIVQPFVYVYLGQPQFNRFSALTDSWNGLEYALEVAFVACVTTYVGRAWQRLEKI